MIKMTCRKCFFEVRKYLHELGSVTQEIGWTNAELFFRGDFAPAPNEKGQYLNIHPERQSYSDEFIVETCVEGGSDGEVDLLGQLFEAVMDVEDFGELQRRGFKPEQVVFNVIPSEEGGVAWEVGVHGAAKGSLSVVGR